MFKKFFRIINKYFAIIVILYMVYSLINTIVYMKLSDIIKYNCHAEVIFDIWIAISFVILILIPASNALSNKKYTFTWKDIVKIKGKVYAEEFKISGKMDGDAYQIDDFIIAVAEKHGVEYDAIETYLMDDIEFNPKDLPFGAEDCGCYINGQPEWLIDLDSDN